MPFFIPEDQTVAPLAPSGVAPQKPLDPTATETLGAAFRQDNTVVSLFQRLRAESFPPEPDYSLNDDPGFRDSKFEQQHADRFLDSRSLGETRAIMRRIEEEDEDRRILDASGFPGLVAQIAAGTIDPTIALPAGQIVRSVKGGYSVMRTAALTGAAAGVQAAVQEGILQATQETRTAGETALAIGSATVLGGFIGAGTAALLTKVEREALAKSLDMTRADIDAHAGNVPPPADNSNVPIASAVGAAATDTRQLELFGSIPGTGRLSVTRRVMGADSDVGRRTMADLAEMPYRFKENVEGIPTTQGPALDRLARMEINGARVEVSDEMDRLFAEYRFGNAEQTFPRFRAQFERMTGNDTGKMTFGEFKREVSRALQENDQHSVPQVAQAAQKIRKRVFDPWKERAIAAGLLPEDVSPVGAESYFQRVYNKEAIVARRTEFVNIVTEWLTGDQTTKASAKERLTWFNAQLNSLNEHVRKLEGRFARAEERAKQIDARAAERSRDDRPKTAGFNEPDATGRTAEMQRKAAELELQAEELKDGVELARELSKQYPTMGPVLKARVDELERKYAKLGLAEARHKEAGFAAKRSERRLASLEEQLSKTEARKELIDDMLVVANEYRAEVRAKIEAEIGAWEGKSATEAKSAIKTREKYASESARAEDADRLKSADDAVDRVVKRIIESDRDLSTVELRNLAHEITDRIIGSPDGRLPYDVHAGGPQIGPPRGGESPRGPLAARQFAIPDKMIREFLEDDVEHVIAMHLRTMVPDVMLTERFGDVRMTEAFRKINEEYAAKIDATKSEKTRTKLNNERDAVIRDLAAVRDRIRGVYGWSPDLRNAARVVGAAKVLNNLTSMGSAAISSLPDFAGAVFRYGLTSTLRDGWMPFFNSLSGNSEAWSKAKAQWRAIGIGIETTTNARQNALDDVFDVYRPQSRVERALQTVNDKFFIANMLAPLTDFQKTAAANVASSEILRAAKAAGAGKATKQQIANLAESGIDLQMASRISGAFEQAGEIIDGVHLPNTADWADVQARRAFEGAVARDVDIMVITPGQEKPLWMSHPVYSILGQFKAFTAASTERILIANLQRRDASALSGLVFSVGLGMLAYKINAVTGGTATSDRPQDWIKEGINRSGINGWLEEGNALASKMTRGGVDIYRMIGADKPLTRFASRSTLDMLLGPTAGKITSLAQVTGAAAAGEWTESDTKAVRRLTAFQNLFYLRSLFNQVEAGTNGIFGVEMRAKPGP